MGQTGIKAAYMATNLLKNKFWHFLHMIEIFYCFMQVRSPCIVFVSKNGSFHTKVICPVSSFLMWFWSFPSSFCYIYTWFSQWFSNPFPLQAFKEYNNVIQTIEVNFYSDPPGIWMASNLHGLLNHVQHSYLTHHALCPSKWRG